MTEILYDARWIGNHGIGRFASELYKRIPGLNAYRSKRSPCHPLDPALLSAALRKQKPGIFFSPGYNSPIGWNKPFVFSLHDLNHLCVRDNSNSLKRAYYKYIIKPACHRAACVLTVSEYSKHEIADWANVCVDKVVNVGNGVGPPFTPQGHKYEPGFPYLLYVGSRKPHKNLPRLLQAYSASGVAREVKLILSGHADKQILIEIDRWNLRSDVVFADVSVDDDLAAMYRGAKGFVFPSLYEGFGLPPVEAMACGVPVLTSNLCSLPEVTGDAAILVNPNDIEEIKEGIRQLVFNSELRTQLTIKGIQRVRNFSWNESARKVKELLLQIQR